MVLLLIIIIIFPTELSFTGCHLTLNPILVIRRLFLFLNLILGFFVEMSQNYLHNSYHLYIKVYTIRDWSIYSMEETTPLLNRLNFLWIICLVLLVLFFPRSKKLNYVKPERDGFWAKLLLLYVLGNIVDVSFN